MNGSSSISLTDPSEAPTAPMTFSNDLLSTFGLNVRPRCEIPQRDDINDAGRSPL